MIAYGHISVCFLLLYNQTKAWTLKAETTDAYGRKTFTVLYFGKTSVGVLQQG